VQSMRQDIAVCQPSRRQKDKIKNKCLADKPSRSASLPLKDG
jgi:hypothetical protein